MKKFIELIKDFKDFRDFKKEFIEFSVLREKFKKGQEILSLFDELQVTEIKMQQLNIIVDRGAGLNQSYAKTVSQARRLETAAKELETTLKKMLKEYS
ncbi:hypothetical protein UFOVP457_66 [uncultured Caudovirales phage]|uniref:Uncharacterized protein n=1 Tax=uncultured Caudovirales phage TaxID=2100421 RepID=A0A6J5MI42_9CAUD|nr:hypothetical protein UFOVP457_66 [uncultured Caudovirales phage]